MIQLARRRALRFIIGEVCYTGVGVATRSIIKRPSHARSMFSPELERDAFRASNGEFGWTRGQIPAVVESCVPTGSEFLVGNYGG